MRAAASRARAEGLENTVRVPLRGGFLAGTLSVPPSANALVLFAHGCGSSHASPRNVLVARAMQRAGIATLLFDPLTAAEETIDLRTRHYRFDIRLLAARLVLATGWARERPELAGLPIGYFGAVTGSAAALVAAAGQRERVQAVVSRGGRPDLAWDALPSVTAPTLLIAGGFDTAVAELNRRAYGRLRCRRSLKIVPGASQLFEEPGALEQVAALASAWFLTHLQPVAIAAH